MSNKPSPGEVATQEEQALQHGRQASNLLQDPAFQRATARVRQGAIEIFEKSQPADTAAREEAYYTLRALQAVEQQLGKDVRGANVVVQKRAKKEEVSGGTQTWRKQPRGR